MISDLRAGTRWLITCVLAEMAPTLGPVKPIRIITFPRWLLWQNLSFPFVSHFFFALLDLAVWGRGLFFGEVFGV